MTQASKSAPHDLENEHGDAHFFFAFLAKVDHYLSVRGNVLGANVLKTISTYRMGGLSDDSHRLCRSSGGFSSLLRLR